MTHPTNPPPIYLRYCHVLLAVLAALSCAGCALVEDTLFPVWPPNNFTEPPAPLGPYAVVERRIEVSEGADGAPFGITLFEPNSAMGPLPAFIWVMGSNVQAYYHQSLHEHLASWGYVVLVPDTRPLRFLDFQYHERILLLAEQTLDLALSGELGVEVDDTALATGGYSVGGPLAVFFAARRAELDAIVHWAPSPAPIWQGLNPNKLYERVGQPSLYILGTLDDDAPPRDGYPDELQAVLVNSSADEVIIDGAVHHQFQQPTGADQFGNEPEISRIEQQGIAITATRLWLDVQFGIDR